MPRPPPVFVRACLVALDDAGLRTGMAAQASYLVLERNDPRGAFLVTGTSDGNLYSNSGIYLYGSNNTISNVDRKDAQNRDTGSEIPATVTNEITFDQVYVHDNNPGDFAHNANLVGCDFVYITLSRFMTAHTGDGLHFDSSSNDHVITRSECSRNDGEGMATSRPRDRTGASRPGMA